MRVAFDGWVYDAETRELRSEGRAVHVEPKAFELLGVLIANRPRALSKSELMQRVWPATFVSEANLSSLIAGLRAALGDEPRQSRYIRTVHGFGYAFCGTAQPLEASGGSGRSRAAPGTAGEELCLRLLWEGREIALAGGENLLGRTRGAVVWIPSSTVSRRHARIQVVAGQATLEDLGSKNGTYLGGERIAGPRALRDGDVIRVGSAEMVFRALPAGFSTETEGLP